MSRSIDKIEDIFFAILCFIYDSHGLCFDRNSTFTLQFHIIKDLSLHFPLRQKPRLFYDSICQSRFPMVNMGNNTKISNVTLFYF